MVKKNQFMCLHQVVLHGMKIAKRFLTENRFLTMQFYLGYAIV